MLEGATPAVLEELQVVRYDLQELLRGQARLEETLRSLSLARPRGGDVPSPEPLPSAGGAGRRPQPPLNLLSPLSHSQSGTVINEEMERDPSKQSVQSNPGKTVKLQGRDFMTNLGVVRAAAGFGRSTARRHVLVRAGGGAHSLGLTWNEARLWIILDRLGLPLRPDSRPRIVMDWVGMSFLLYDSMVVPYMIAYEQRFAGFFLAVACVTATFWAADIVVNFATCPTKDDVLVTRWRSIVLNYLRTWFFLDIGTLTLDWFAIGLALVDDGGSSNSALASYVKLGRSMKVIRVVRVIIRLFVLLYEGKLILVEDAMLRSARAAGFEMYSSFVMGIVKLVLLILWVNHLGSCVWWVVIESEASDTGLSWGLELANTYGADQVNVNDSRSVTFWYGKGFYWSLTTMFSFASTVDPTTSTETAACLVVIMLGILFTSTLISSVAAMLVDIQMMRRDQNDKLRVLRRFLRQHTVEPLVSSAVQRQIAERMSQNEKHVCVKDVPTIALLSTRLRAALWCEIYRPPLTQHAVLQVCDYLDEVLIRELCSSLSTEFVNQHDDLFEPGIAMEQAYVLLSGSLRYTLDFQASMSPTLPNMPAAESVETVANEWLCELALWSHWTTLGEAEAVGASELLVVPAADLGAIVSSRPEVARIAQDYCDTLCRASEHGCTFSDLRSQCSIGEDALCCAMPPESRRKIALPALDALQAALGLGHVSGGGAGAAAMRELRNESHGGDCILRVRPPGQAGSSPQVVRVVHVVSAKLRRRDGLVCAHIGEWDAQDAEPVPAPPQLPGTKVQGGELAIQAVKRLCDELALISPSVDEEKVEIEEKPADKFGVATRYVRSVYVVSCEGTSVAPIILPRDNDGSDHSVELFRVHWRFYAWLHDESFHRCATSGFLVDIPTDLLPRVADWIQHFCWKEAGLDISL